MNPALKTILEKAIPQPLIKPTKSLYARLKPILQEAPAATIYLNRPDVRTYVGMNNFYSWVAPSEHKGSTLKLVFYAADGRKILEHREKVAYFGTASLDIRALFEKAGVRSDFGIYSLRLEPASRWNAEYQKLGTLKEIFFSLHKYENGSVSIVHPNSRLGAEPPCPSGEWRSSQVFQTFKLARIRIYQMMPIEHVYPVTYSLVCNQTNAVVASKHAECLPLSGTEIGFDLAGLEALPAEVRLVMSAWPVNNAKPLIERIFANGLSSICHA